MTHNYNITGMTCAGCQSKVQSLLSDIPGVKTVAVDLGKGQAEIAMDKHIATPVLQDALKQYPNYHLTENHQTPVFPTEETETKKSWLATYRPILLIFGYISVLSLILGKTDEGFDWMAAMRVFMSGFFLTFSFFKLLDLDGFADSYSTYDIIAKRFRPWAYLYAFIELLLGIAFAVNFQLLLTNLATVVVMSVSIVGVLQSVLNKRKIRCACLGAVFNLPMSTITIVEDAVMIVMSGAMLLMLL